MKVDMDSDLNEKETMTVTPKELEYAFAQAARFGAWMHFAYQNDKLFSEVIEKTTGEEEKDLSKIDESKNQEKYKEAMIKLCWMFMNETPNGCDIGRTVQRNLSRLFLNEEVWNQIEVFNDLCDHAQKIKSFSK